MHLTEEQVQRVLHGELAPEWARDVRTHLDSCRECRDRLDREEREEQWVLASLARLDHATPSVVLEDVTRSSRSGVAKGWGRWAAGILLGAAMAGAAYAVPGSPVRAVVDRIVGASQVREAAAPVDPVDTAVAQAGIAVAPGERLTILFQTAVAGDTAVVSLSDSADVVIQGRGGQTGFTSDPARVVIRHEGILGRFDILIPKSAPFVSLEVGNRRVLLKRGSRVTSEAAPDASGRYTIPLHFSP